MTDAATYKCIKDAEPGIVLVFFATFAVQINTDNSRLRGGMDHQAVMPGAGDVVTIKVVNMT